MVPGCRAASPRCRLRPFAPNGKGLRGCANPGSRRRERKPRRFHHSGKVGCGRDEPQEASRMRNAGVAPQRHVKRERSARYLANSGRRVQTAANITKGTEIIPTMPSTV